MATIFFRSLCLFVIGATCILAQALEKDFIDNLPPIDFRIGSKFRVHNSYFRITPNKVLPISIAIANYDKIRSISLHIVASSESGDPSYIPNGFNMLGKNPTDKMKINIDECKIIRTKIRINTHKYQQLTVIVLDENNLILNSHRIFINHPKYSDSSIWKYMPFDEKKLCVFRPPNARY
ncbi:MAG: hypothetical protein FWG02_11230 [Holophagaceae bacterium]|nr:hypothetical protein [Holophagaceae bacterium]